MPLVARTPKLPCFNERNHLTKKFNFFPIVIKKNLSEHTHGIVAVNSVLKTKERRIGMKRKEKDKR